MVFKEFPIEENDILYFMPISNLNYRPVLTKLILLIAGFCLLQSAVSAQVTTKSIIAQALQTSFSRTSTEIIAESAPSDDEVLSMAPSQLGLNFPQTVRLVKLVLYNEKKEWIDISFRYDPRPDSSFSWPIPYLQRASYYTADWAVLAAGDLLVRGSFSFTFGAGAESPSVHKEREALLLDMRNILPEIQRLQRLGLDPAEIIINNDEPRKFEPPFAPILN